jgi:hypothetical protein
MCQLLPGCKYANYFLFQQAELLIVINYFNLLIVKLKVGVITRFHLPGVHFIPGSAKKS